MKRLEYISHLQKLSPADLQKEIAELEKKIQSALLAISFGKSKEVHTLHLLKRNLARALTIGNQKVQALADAAENKGK